MTEFSQLDRLRRRWCDYRARLRVPDPVSGAGASPAGLAARLNDVSSRVVILPPDPLSVRIDFDDEFWAWWDEPREAPFGGQLMWHSTGPTVNAAVKVRTTGPEWSTYLALNRHGGVEVGTSDTYGRGDTRYFRLVRTVGLVWIALDRQVHAAERFGRDGPWEVTLALHNTRGCFLGEFGEGWAEPGRSVRPQAPCFDTNVVVREELETFPHTPEAIRDLAFRVGGRIDDAWGVRQRRFLDHRGEGEGQFSVQHWRL